MEIKKALKGMSVPLSFCLLLCSYSFSSYAYQIRINENGNFIKTGGINSYDGERAESYEATVSLETTLRDSDYILVNTDFRDISDEEYNLFCSCGFWFSSYISNDEYYKSMYRVYVYEPSFNDFMKQYDEKGSTEDYTHMEINSSTVVVSYGYWDSLKKAGTVSDEFDDNIPEGRESGYLQIISPVDAEIKLHFPITDRYFDFFVQADTPFFVRLKTGAYNITDVNGCEFKDGENTIKNNNIIHIKETYTAENPYILELYELFENYSIPPVDISEEPVTTELNTNIPKYQATVLKETENNKTDGNSNVLLVTAIIIIILITAVWIYKKKKENDNER